QICDVFTLSTGRSSDLGTERGAMLGFARNPPSAGLEAVTLSFTWRWYPGHRLAESAQHPVGRATWSNDREWRNEATGQEGQFTQDRKSTRLNSSHVKIS